MSKDPIGFAAGDTNQYRYVGNGSASFMDPSGMAKGFGNEVWEKVGGVFAVGPYDAFSASGSEWHTGWLAKEATDFGNMKADDDVDRAREEAEKRGETLSAEEEKQIRSDMFNCARHAYWQAVLTILHGEEDAESLAGLHEAGEQAPPDPAGEWEKDRIKRENQGQDSERDIWNNRIGREMGKKVGGRVWVLLSEEFDSRCRAGDFVLRRDDPRISPPAKYGDPGPLDPSLVNESP